MKILQLTIFIIAASITHSFSQNLEGVWHGYAKSPDNREILFVFLFEKSGDTFKATMAIPTFDVTRIKPKSTIFKDGKLIVDDADVGMNYEGYWNESTNQFDGVYKEPKNNMSMVLALRKGNPTMVPPYRPQNPAKPYPYLEENVTFENTKANIQLAGTFTRPKGDKKFPVVILISGSGRHDRNESMAAHMPFLVLADYLTRKGIAVLRYDDRGFKGSTGDFSTATTADFAEDVLSAVSYLKSRKDIDPKKIGLIGHSEGGIIAPLAANQSSDIKFIVTLAATGIPGSELTLMQSKSMRPFPVPDEAEFGRNVKKSIEIASSNLDISEKRETLLAHNTSYLSPILTSLGVPEEKFPALIANETETYLKPWNVYFYTYNPADEFEKLKIPVLSLNGSKDTQVDASVNLTAIEKALEKGGNKNYKVMKLKNLNHMFQKCETGQIDEYEKIEETMSPKVMRIIARWIKKVN